MVVVAVPPSEAAFPSILVCSTHQAWRAVAGAQTYTRRMGATVVLGAAWDPDSRPPDASVAALVREAGIVVLGNEAASIAKLQAADLLRALLECHRSGGLLVTVGQEAGSLLGMWRHRTPLDEGGQLVEGLGLLHDIVVGVVTDKPDWSEIQKCAGKAHSLGHVGARGVGVVAPLGVAAFYVSSATAHLGSAEAARTEVRFEAVGTEPLLEVSALPKAGSFGKVLKLRVVQSPDHELQRSLGFDPQTRWANALDIAADWLIDCQGTAVVSTGAGVSAESGIPTYRDEGGLWDLYDQMEVSHIKGFIRDPLKCWRFELELHQKLKTCTPNAAHKALAAMEREGLITTVVTQNVDGLHVKSGSRDVIELHGSETRGICMQPECRRTEPYDSIFGRLGWINADGSTNASAPHLPQKKERTVGGVYAELTDSSRSSSPSGSSASSRARSADSRVSRGPAKFADISKKLHAKSSGDAVALQRMGLGPRCQACGKGMLKPDAVYFGEALPGASIRRARKLSKAAKAFLIVGTSGAVAPACTLPRLAKLHGKAKVIEVSPRETDLSDSANVLLLGTAAFVLPQLLDAVIRRAEERKVDLQRERIARVAAAAKLETCAAPPKKKKRSSTRESNAIGSLMKSKGSRRRKVLRKPARSFTSKT